MDELESELEEPTGISTVRAPELSLEGVLLSQDCGIMYEINHGIGVQYVVCLNWHRSLCLTELLRTKRLYGKISTCALRFARSPTSADRVSPDSGISTLVNFFLLALFRRQAAESSSAAGLSRVSRYTFLIQSLIDAISFVGVGCEPSCA